MRDEAATGASLFVCHEGVTSYLPGDPLQLAGDLALETDPAVVQAQQGMSAACACTDYWGNTLPCVEFDAG